MPSNSFIYFIIFEFLGFLLLFFSFYSYKFKSPKKLTSKFFLFSSALLFSIGLFEPILFLVEKQSTPSPSPPPILTEYKSHSHNHIKNSILYVLPPYFVPPHHGKFRTFGHSFTTNHLGFREKRFSHRKKSETFRILIFGDSLTFGVGIDDDHRYSNVLEELFKINFPKKNIEVLNFGIPGYSLDQEHDLIKTILKLVECDLVILGVFRNDLQRTTQNTLKEITRLKYGEPSQPFYQKVNGKNVADSSCKCNFGFRFKR